jgi:hypothetical protein
LVEHVRYPNQELVEHVRYPNLKLTAHLGRAQALIANVKGQEAANRYAASIQALLG